MSQRRLLVVASALLALSLSPAAARAAYGPSSVAATPSSLQAGAHADLALTVALPTGDDVRNLTIHLPEGLVGNPQSQPVCTQAQFAADGCPAASQVGITTVSATVTQTVLLVPVTASQDVAGKVFNLAPNAGEPARLGILLPSASALGGAVTTKPVRLQSVVSVRSSGDYGLDSVITDMPRTIETNLGTATAHIDKIVLTLAGTAAGASKPFLTNPTTCAIATTTVDATGYSGASGSGSSTFTPTGCDKVAYRPTITATLDGAGLNQHPALTTVVGQGADEATSKTVAVTLPDGVGANGDAVATPCPTANFDAGTCPAANQVGTATAVTPLLADPLTGPVYIVAPAAGALLPGLGISLGGLLPVTLHASVSLAGGRLISTLDGLPDVPLSSFTLVLKGGTGGLLTATRNLCTAPPTVDAAFTAQSGLAATSSSTVTATHCAGPATPSGAGSTPAKAAPSVRPTFTAKLSKAGTLTVVTKVRKGASKLRTVRLTLPRGLKADATKRLRVARKGAATITLTVSHTHLKLTRSTLSRKATITVTVTNAAKKTYKVKVRLKR